MGRRGAASGPHPPLVRSRIDAFLFGTDSGHLSAFLPGGCFLLEPQLHLTDSNVIDWLVQVGLLSPGEPAVCEKAGEGNINWVRRIRVLQPGRSFIVKQARPALERFPEYQVTTDRLLFEGRFYAAVAELDPERVCPDVLALVEGERVLVLEDLGDCERLDEAIARGSDVTQPASRLARFLARVHGSLVGGALAERFGNFEMQRLHGDHIFELPLRRNDFPLAPRVRDRADALARDPDVVRTADAAYRRYRESHDALVHGDVQVGNILLAARGPVLLDAEIAHVGDPAFDVGTLLAHLLAQPLARGDGAAGLSLARSAWEAYRAAFPGDRAPVFREVARYAGLEILRRTIGAARIRCAVDEEPALALLDFAVPWIVAPPGSLHAG